MATSGEMIRYVVIQHARFRGALKVDRVHTKSSRPLQRKHLKVVDGAENL